MKKSNQQYNARRTIFCLDLREITMFLTLLWEVICVHLFNQIYIKLHIIQKIRGI